MKSPVCDWTVQRRLWTHILKVKQTNSTFAMLAYHALQQYVRQPKTYA